MSRTLFSLAGFQVIISGRFWVIAEASANLTDDAFLRNLELGVLFMGGDMPTKLRQHFEHLIALGTLLRWNP
jgi:phosphatidylserine/phosphatidylglycerophosphate/cardiolipin synthase-like enzyme